MNNRKPRSPLVTANRDRCPPLGDVNGDGHAYDDVSIISDAEFRRAMR